MAQLVLGLLIFALLIILFMRWQAKGYEKYVFYVHAHDTAIFSTSLKPSDPRIRKFGRILKEDALAIDRKDDNDNGEKSGTVRWYICSGIDCDEGWESRFIR